MIPSSKAFESTRRLPGAPRFPALSLALVLAGCAGAGGPVADGRRHPDGVAIDPVSAPLHVGDRAQTADGLVTLRTPLGTDRAIATVAELFRKIVIEDAEGMDSLFISRALAIQPGMPPGSAPQAAIWWPQRLHRLKGKYAQLAGETIYREAELEIFRGEDAALAARAVPISPDLLEPNDVVIRVPILLARVGPDRLFADELTLWLRRDGDRYKIYQAIEDFQLN